MAYNIIKGRVEFSNSSTGSIESLVDIWRNQSVGGTKTFTSNITASGYWDSTRDAKIEPLSTLISSDAADRVLTSDGDGTLTAEPNVTINTVASVTSLNVSGHITGSTFSGSAHGLTGIILNPDHLAATNYDGLTNRLSASNIVLGIGLSSSVHVAPASSGHGPELQVTGGQGIVVDTEGVRVLTASNGGLKFTGQTLQVDAASTTNKGGGPSNNDEFIIADSSDSDSIKNLTYSQIKTAITDSISVPITTYNNSGDNRIITSVNSTTVNAEANLSFNGTNIELTGGIVVSGSRAIKNSSVPAFQVSATGDGSIMTPDHVSINMGAEARLHGNLAISNARGANQAGIFLSKTGSSYLVDGDDIGHITFNTRGDTTRVGNHANEVAARSARIFVEADGSEHNGESKPGRMSFWTCPTGTINPVQRMVINNSGNVGIGSFNTPDHKLAISGAISASLGISSSLITVQDSITAGKSNLKWYENRKQVLQITGGLHVNTNGHLAGGNAIEEPESCVSFNVGELTRAFRIAGPDLNDGGTWFNINSDSGRINFPRGNIAIGTFDTPDHKLAVSGAISASLNISASGFIGDGSLLTGVGGGGIFTEINGSLANTTSSIAIGGTTAPDHKLAVSGAISASLNISASGFIGDGSGLTGVTGEWDGSHTGNATIDGTLSASNGLRSLDLVLDAGGTGRIGVAGDTDLMTLTADTVLIAGALSGTAGVHISGSDPHVQIGAKRGDTVAARKIMFNVTPRDTDDKVLMLAQSREGSEVPNRTIFAVTGSGKVLVGGANTTGVFNVSGSDAETLIHAKSDTTPHAFILSSAGVASFGGAVSATNFNATVGGITTATLSASSVVDLVGATNFGKGNQTTVSNVGVLSSSATATFHNIQTDRATVQEINTVPAGAGTVELVGALNTTGHITSSLGVHVTGSEPSVAIGDHKGTGMSGMLSIRPSGDLGDAENNKVLALFQRSDSATIEPNRIIFAVTGSGRVAVGGGHLDGVFNVSGSDAETLISVRNDTHNPAFTVGGGGDAFIKGDTINSGSFTSSGSIRAPLLRETIHAYAPGDTNASFIRFYETGRNTSFDKKVIMVKPYLGNLDKIIARGTSAAGSTAISFHKAGDGSATPNGTAIETVTVDMSSANTSYTFIFDPATSKFAAGDIVSVKVDPSSDPGDITLTCVWEYDTRTT